jgi:hypothetical protein
VIVEIVLSTMPFNVSFPRFLNQNNIVLWNDLVRRIMHIRINDQADVFVWNLHQNGQYTVKDRGRRPKGGGGLNGSLIKFFCKNWPMSQVQTPEPKPCKKVMNTPTNNIEITPLKVQTQKKKNGINWTPG